MSRETYCFDMYGTLVDTSSVTQRLRRELDVSAGFADVIDAHWREKQLQYSYLEALMGDTEPFIDVTERALAYTLEYFSIDVDDTEPILSAYDDLEPFPDAAPALEGLTAAGHTCVVLSNGNPEMLDAVASATGLEEFLSDKLSAHATGTFKPAPAVYQLAAAALEKPIGDCWMVSANAWDASGAAAAGMQTAWINRRGDPVERVGGDYTRELNALTELLD